MENGASWLERWMSLRVSGISLFLCSSQLAPFSRDILRNISRNILRLPKTFTTIPSAAWTHEMVQDPKEKNGPVGIFLCWSWKNWVPCTHNYILSCHYFLINIYLTLQEKKGEKGWIYFSSIFPPWKTYLLRHKWTKRQLNYATEEKLRLLSCGFWDLEFWSNKGCQMKTTPRLKEEK